MRLKYTLINDVEGEYIAQYSPKGWQETELVLKRHEKYEGIFLDYTVKADFFCGSGKEYIDNIYDTQGIAADLKIRIEMDCNDSGDFELLYDGKAIMKSYEKIQAAPEYTRINLEEDGIIQSVLNRMDTKIDLTKTETLDGTALSTLTYAPYDLTTHSKELILTGEVEVNGSPYPESFNIFSPDTFYITIPFDNVDKNEIPDFQYTLPPYISSLNVSPPPEVQPFYINNTSDSITIPFDYEILGEFREVYADGRTYNLSLVYKISSSNNPSGGGITFHSFGSKSPAAGVTMIENINLSGQVTYTIPAGESLYLYFVVSNYIPDSVPFNMDITMDFESFRFTGTINSIEDDSITKSFAIFETGADIARKITNQVDAFRSNLFGRKNSEPYAYDSNGCESFNAFTNGFQLRGFPLADRPVYMSMREYFEGLNAIMCLGLGVKQEGDNTYIEVEPKEYFYRNNEVILTLNNVRGLTTKLDPRHFYNRFTIGYKDWRKEGLNGLDEFCTNHNYALLLKSVNNELVAQSEFIAAPYALERQRRERYAETVSTDEDYDNNNFIISLNRSEDGSGVPNMLNVAEKDENFTDVENVLSPSTIYNLRKSPARSARNWFKILSTSLIKLNGILKDVKFTFAEGNKTMTSKGSDFCDPANGNLISEGEDLEILIPGVSDEYEPLFTGEIDTIEDYPLSFSSYSMLKELDDEGVPNYYKMVRYSIGESDYLFGFIDELRYKPVIGKASFTFRRAYNMDQDCTHIYVESGYVECGYVE